MQEEESIHITDNAAKKVCQLMEEEGDASLKLRVYVVGGGCSGFQYGFGFETENQEGDIEFHDANQTMTLIVDPMSIQYLVSAEIDYVQDLHGARFVVRNPNAMTTCGCGSSFSID